MNRYSQPSCPQPRNTSGSSPSRDLQAAKLQRARAKNGRTGPIGRSASKKNYSSTAKTRTFQPVYGDNRYVETGNGIGNQIGDYEYHPRKTTTILKLFYVVEAHTFPWHVYKQDLMKLNLQTVRMLNGARLSVNGLYSIAAVDWLIAAGINFSSTTALRFADLEGLPSNNTMGLVSARPLQDVKMSHDEGK